MLMMLLLVLALSGLAPSPSGQSASEPMTLAEQGPAVASLDYQGLVAAENNRNTEIESTLPDFASITNVQDKKQTFFEFLLPQVREANDKIRTERRHLLKLRDLVRTSELDRHHLKSLAALVRKYRVKANGSPADMIDALLLRVDVVPESLVLAQAANESGWGTSRFARQANNLFGVWCFSPGCGLPPLRREEGLTHEVASYASIQASIEAYLHTLNTNAAYVELRHIRADSRADELHISGLAMAEGLLRYSARGADYVREIQAMIRTNNLQRFNLPAQA